MRAEIAEGVRAVRHDRSVRLIVTLTAGQTASYGALSVLVVGLVAEVLRAGHEWVGYLNAAVGLGGVAGALVLAPFIAPVWGVAPRPGSRCGACPCARSGCDRVSSWRSSRRHASGSPTCSSTSR